MEGFLSVKEATKSYAQGCKAKAATPIGKLFGKAMLAGMMIGMGAAASSVAAHSVANVGLARLTAAVVFPVGLMMVILLGAVTSGILCNILVCAAVLMAICAKDISGKLLVSFFVIMLFVTAGFEHCVANMYYITAGLFCKMNPDYVNKAMELYGYTEAQLSQLSWGSFLVKNLIPVTLGNIVGGICCIGLPLLYLNREKK